MSSAAEQHVIRQIAGAAVHDEPYPHLYLESV